MKKLLLTLVLVTLCGITLSGCTKDTELEQLRLENASLKEKLGTDNVVSVFSGNENKPNIVKITLSWIGGALSRQTETIGDQIYYNKDIGEETLPINSKDVANEFIGYYFNSAGDLLIASCNDGFVMRSCKPFSNTDNVSGENKDNQCMLQNEDPNLMRTSMIIECDKI